MPALWLANTSCWKFIIRLGTLPVEAEFVADAAGLDVQVEGQGFCLVNLELGDVVDRALVGDLLERQRAATPGEVLYGATDHRHAWLAGLEHGDIEHALILAAGQARGRGHIRLQHA